MPNSRLSPPRHRGAPGRAGADATADVDGADGAVGVVDVDDDDDADGISGLDGAVGGAAADADASPAGADAAVPAAPRTHGSDASPHALSLRINVVTASSVARRRPPAELGRT